MSRIKSDHGKATAFWLELVLSLCAMMICGCICLFVFVQADRESKLSRAETEALLRLQSAAEQFKSQSSDLPASFTEDVFYSKSWTPLVSQDTAPLTAQDGAVYRMEVHLSEDKGLATAVLTMETMKSGQELCSLTVKKYLPERGLE